MNKRMAELANLAGGLLTIVSVIAFELDSSVVGSVCGIVALVLVVRTAIYLERW